ncbi:MAG: hypothetical protein ACFFDF_09740 [Candidatus Odinarchaeota archaeon]
MKQELPDEHYKKKLNSITNVLQNSKIGLAKITPAGSRAKQEHRPDSDQDVILAVSGNPSRKEFYPKLENILKSNFPNDEVYLGHEGNIIHLDFKSGAEFELVLQTRKNFDKELQCLKIYKRKHL